jgi:hypothetical protein
VQLEKERFTRLETLEFGFGGRSPEVHFLDSWMGCQECEPLEIGNAKVELHRSPDKVGKVHSQNAVIRLRAEA